MSRGTLLSLVNVSLLAGVLLAATDVVAQVQPSTGDNITYTICGPGTLEPCGKKTLWHCEWKVDIRFSTIPFSGGVTFLSQQCVKSGEIPLYKNHVGPVYPTCIESGIPNRPPGEAPAEEYLDADDTALGVCTE